MHHIVLVSSNHYFHEILEQFCIKRDDYQFHAFGKWEECVSHFTQDMDIYITDNYSPEHVNSINVPILYLGDDIGINIANNVVVVSIPFYLDDFLVILRTKLEAFRIKKSKRIKWSVFVLDVIAKELQHIPTGQKMLLTDKEIAIVVCLYSLRDKGALRHEDLAEYILGHENTIDSHAIPSHIYRVRQKLAELSIEEDFIISDKNGYQLVL